MKIIKLIKFICKPMTYPIYMTIKGICIAVKSLPKLTKLTSKLIGFLLKRLKDKIAEGTFEEIFRLYLFFLGITFGLITLACKLEYFAWKIYLTLAIAIYMIMYYIREYYKRKNTH